MGEDLTRTEIEGSCRMDTFKRNGSSIHTPSRKRSGRRYLKAHGKKPMEPEKLGPSPLAPKECWRCGHENAPTHRFCARCGVVLTRKQASKMVERKTMPLDKIIASEKTEIIEFLKALTKEELQLVISDFFNPLKGELKELRKQIHTEYKEVNRSLEELRAVKREVDKRLSESFT